MLERKSLAVKKVRRVNRPRSLREQQATYTITASKARGTVPLRAEDWEIYRGETIAFVGNTILAHGVDLDRVLEQVWTQYGKKPNQVGLVKIARARHKLL
jgi:hypothetical protein